MALALFSNDTEYFQNDTWKPPNHWEKCFDLQMSRIVGQFVQLQILYILLIKMKMMS